MDEPQPVTQKKQKPGFSGLWVITLIIGFIVGAAFAGIWLEKSLNENAIKKAVFTYCTDTNQLNCTAQCQLLDLPACQAIQQSILPGQ